jgi:hypothetical protein
MLQELNKQAMKSVVGGQLSKAGSPTNIPGTKFLPGLIQTIYVDKDGNIVCGTPPWLPKPKPNVDPIRPKL